MSPRAAPALEVAFARHRRTLWGLCYRMVGVGADADDLVQETFARALAHPPADCEGDLKPWLARVAINACRDHLRKRKRQGYSGPWLPGPIETPLDDPFWQGAESPDARYSRLESVSMAFLRASEALGPRQRAVLLLRDVFDCSVRETAEILEVSESNVKTTLHRARGAMAGYDAARPDFSEPRRAQALRTLRALLLHMTANNVEALRVLLRDDAVMLNDGGGEFFAARKPVVGRDKILTFHRKTRRSGPLRAGFRILNGMPAILVTAPVTRPGVAPCMVGWIELDAAGRITELHWVLASRKLHDLDFIRLAPPTWRELAGSLHDALAVPGLGRWLAPASRRLGRAAFGYMTQITRLVSSRERSRRV